MKHLYLLLLFTAISLVLSAQTYTVDGHAFLENQTDHSGINVTLNRVAPTSLTYTCTTDAEGYYSTVIEEGIYSINFSKDNYIPISFESVMVYSNIQTDVVTLEMSGLSGELFGVIHSGTYLVYGDISVPSGQTLTIEAGTTFLFFQDVSFKIYGTLIAEGSETDSIIFTHKNLGETWSGIRIYTQEVVSMAYCCIEHSNYFGIHVDFNSPFMINHSEIRYNSLDGIITQYGNNHYNNLKIHDNGNHGMSFTGMAVFSTHNIISNCLIYDNVGNGINFSIGLNSPDGLCPIVTNTIIVNNLNGINSDASTPIFTNNIIANNHGYGVIFSEYGNREDFSVTNKYFAFNNVFNNPDGNFLNPLPNVGVNITTNSNGSPCDAYHNTQLDPLFIDSDNNNFRLAFSSPCIDAGLNDSVYYPSDFDGNTRIWDGDSNGSAIVDMGAYESGAPLYVSINELKNISEGVGIYPNPTNGIIRIKFDETETLNSVKISDLTGKIIFQQNDLHPNNPIDISKYKSGVYILTVQTLENVYSVKFIKD